MEDMISSGMVSATADSAENSLRQFERLEKRVNAATTAQANNVNPNQKQQTRPPLSNVLLNRRDDEHAQKKKPTIMEVDDDYGEPGREERSIFDLPPHGENEAEDGSDLPVELSYQKLLDESRANSANAFHAEEGRTTRLASAGTTTSSVGGDNNGDGRSSGQSARSKPVHPKQAAVDAYLRRTICGEEQSTIEEEQKTTETTETTEEENFDLVIPPGLAKTPRISLSSPFSSFTKTPSSLFEPLKVPNFKQKDLVYPAPKSTGFTAAATNNRPLFHSTPQNSQNQMAAKGKQQTSGPVFTPGGRHISPIAEEREELARVLGEANKLNGDTVVKALVTQLRDLIAQWDWALARHKNVSKVYFERQREQLNEGWERLNAEKVALNAEKQEEWARIANLRAALQSDKQKLGAKKEAERIRELEQEGEKLRAKDLMGSQKLSELRTKIRELEGQVRVREQSYTENMQRIKKLERQLVIAEQENSNLRTKNTLLRAAADKQRQQQSSSLNNEPAANAPVGPRSTLFSLMGGTARNPSGFGANAPQQGQTTMRRNNSDGNNSLGGAQRTGQVHRSNSENGPFQQPGTTSNGSSTRRVVRFADPPTATGTTPQAAMVALGNASAASTPSDAPPPFETDALCRRFELPADMMNTIYRITGRGHEYTFARRHHNSGQSPHTVVVTELLPCRTLARQCLLYEWPNECNFRWVNRVREDTVGNNENSDERVQIDYCHADEEYRVRLLGGHLLRYKLDGNVEVNWRNGDRTLILPSGERRELFGVETPQFRMEIYTPDGAACRMEASSQWQREYFVADPKAMSVRADLKSYVTLYVDEQMARTAGSEHAISLQINAPEFQFRRFQSTGALKLVLEQRDVGVIQMWLCVDNVLKVKHVQHGVQQQNSGGKERICFSHGQCRHINLEGNTVTTNLAAVTFDT